MPIFYIHQWSGDHFIEDSEGGIFADLNAARISAIAGARSLLSEEAKSGRFDLNQRLQLHDALGAHHSTILFEDVVEIVWPTGTP